MNITNLCQYIKSGLILKNLPQDLFDVIVYEKFEQGEENKIQVLDDIGYEFGTSGKLITLSKKYKNMLVTIESLKTIYLLPLINSLSKNKITIINLYSGTSGFCTKGLADMDDVSILLNYDINIYEPYDLVSLVDILKKDENKYIRVADKDMPAKIFDQSISDDIISLRGYDLDGDYGTIMVGGYMLNEAIQAVNLLKQDGKLYDLFLINKYNFDINAELKKSISKTKNLIVIVDHIGKGFENYIKSLLWENGIKTKISFIYPQIQSITTIQKDFIYTNCKFDSANIYKILKKH